MANKIPPTPEEPLTPRSRTPVGLIPLHTRYRMLIHKHEVPRKVLHVSIGFLTLWLYTLGVQLVQVTPVLVFLLVTIGTLDVLRFRSEAFSKVYVSAFGFLMRESEIDKWNGIVWYLIGLIVVFLVFPKDISLLSVLLLSWTDTAASTVGRRFGHLTPKLARNKSLAGSLASFVCGVLAAYLLYGVIIPATPQLNVGDYLAWTPETSRLSLPWLCLVAGALGALSEAIDLYGLDDNLTIPVLSACFVTPLLYVLRV
ncbi:cytidylyltransferase family-domain-containing protein [Dipodascopsis tothii]|uniref:cytidylyltransferase family-domain-containing protein n=1 Tax=Dipodascopsis tothii TaxID=44089 RepID=UPI0034CD8EE6